MADQDCGPKVERQAGAESDDHANPQSCPESGAGGGAGPCIKMRQQDRHHEQQKNPLRGEKGIARLLQE